MMFCPKCGSIMIPRKGQFVCPRCSYKIKGTGKKIGEKVAEETKIEIISSEEAEHLPLDKEIICPKCRHKGAYHWEIQTRASDEPATRFFRCAKCRHTWREYD
jgi:DNA-directed RNA polymerase subunit M